MTNAEKKDDRLVAIVCGKEELQDLETWLALLQEIISGKVSRDLPPSRPEKLAEFLAEVRALKETAFG